MRIALVVPGGVDRGGRERVIPVLLSLIERLARRHAVHVVAIYQYPEPCTYPLLGATVHNLGGVRTVPFLASLHHYRRLVALLEEHGPFDVLHAFWAAPCGTLAVLAGKRLGIPSVVSLAGGELTALPDIDYGLQLFPRARLQVARALRLATHVTAASGFMREKAAAYGAAAEEVVLGIDPARFLRASRPPEGPPWRLLFVGSLNRVKAPMTLLAAFRRVADRVPDVHLDIAGIDTLGGQVEARAAELGLDGRVRFHGFVPWDELPALYQQAHLFVLTSRHEAGPLVLLEAAASGVPIVATRVGHAADWAPDGVAAVPVGDDAALAESILALLGDRAHRERMASVARRFVLEHDADRMVERFEWLYR